MCPLSKGFHLDLRDVRRLNFVVVKLINSFTIPVGLKAKHFSNYISIGKIVKYKWRTLFPD